MRSILDSRFGSIVTLAILSLVVPIRTERGGETSSSGSPQVCGACVHANMAFLASDALQGRGSGTRDEWLAATYIASQLEQYGIQPAGENGSYLQRATLLRRKVTGPPRLKFKTGGKASRTVMWTHGGEILTTYLGTTSFSGPLQKVDVATNEKPKIKPGAVLLLTGPEDRVRDAIFSFAYIGASAALVPESSRLRAHWKQLGRKLPEEPTKVEGAQNPTLLPDFAAIAVKDENMATLKRLPEGTIISMQVPVADPEKSYTWNVVGRIAGIDPAQQHATVLLTAHLDHLGMGKPVNGDRIYNGADDDASGTTAVLELARMLASQPKPRRTITFALFGSEESGGLGSSYFRAHPPVPLKDIAAYLEFEMIGRADPATPPGTLWLTGWERSNLGPELAAHGARLVADPHPEQHFFERSDNYVFAKAGVVAQTVSSYGLHKDYHQPSDDIAHIDFQHMDQAIESLFNPVLWLVNSDFVPHWNAEQQP